MNGTRPVTHAIIGSSFSEPQLVGGVCPDILKLKDSIHIDRHGIGLLNQAR